MPKTPATPAPAPNARTAIPMTTIPQPFQTTNNSHLLARSRPSSGERNVHPAAVKRSRDSPPEGFGSRQMGAFVADAKAACLARTSHWLAGKDRLRRREFADRQPGRPYSNVAVATVFDAITKR